MIQLHPGIIDDKLTTNFRYCLFSLLRSISGLDAFVLLASTKHIVKSRIFSIFIFYN